MGNKRDHKVKYIVTEYKHWGVFRLKAGAGIRGRDGQRSCAVLDRMCIESLTETVAFA